MDTSPSSLWKSLHPEQEGPPQPGLPSRCASPVRSNSRSTDPQCLEDRVFCPPQLPNLYKLFQEHIHGRLLWAWVWTTDSCYSAERELILSDHSLLSKLSSGSYKPSANYQSSSKDKILPVQLLSRWRQTPGASCSTVFPESSSLVVFQAVSCKP